MFATFLFYWIEGGSTIAPFHLDWPPFLFNILQIFVILPNKGIEMSHGHDGVVNKVWELLEQYRHTGKARGVFPVIIGMSLIQFLGYSGCVRLDVVCTCLCGLQNTTITFIFEEIMEYLIYYFKVT